MNPTETADILRQFNEWRRGDETIEQPDPREIGEAIDAAVEMIDRLEAAESDALEQARLNGMGAERELALMAKLEAAEKEIALKERIIDSLGSELNAVANERDALRTELADLRSSMTFRTSLIGRIEAERDALQAKVEEMEKQKPVEWQSRSRPTWNNGTWAQWSKCSEGYAKDIMKSPLVQDWIYEARPLYALPGAKGEEK